MSQPAPAITAAAPATALDAVAALLRRHLGLYGLFSLAIAALLLVPTVYMLQVYDRVLATRNETTLALLSLVALGLFGVLGALEAVRGALGARLAVRTQGLLAPAVFGAAFAAAGRPGAVGQGAQPGADLQTLRQFIAGPVPGLAFDAPLALIFVATAFLVDAWLGLFILGCVALLAGLGAWQERRGRAAQQALQRQGGAAAAQLAEALAHAGEARALGMGAALGLRWLAAEQGAAAGQADRGAQTAGQGALLRGLRLAAQSLALGLGALLVLEERITPGMMIAAGLLLGRALAPVEGLVAAARQIGAAREAWARLAAALGAEARRAPPLALPAARGQLSADGLAWQAGPGLAPALVGLRFELAPGEILGVVGASGAGKSLLARLAAGALLPSAGELRLDGAELVQWPEAQRAAAVGYLPQEVHLFEGTVAENIARLGEVDAQQVVRAAQLAGAHEMVLRLPQGYQTRLGGAEGQVLSAGQRQRLGLARAFYGEPALLVLDSPETHLDEQGEQALRRALEAQRGRGGAVLLASQRLSLLQLADRLLALQQGRMVACGPREEVLRQALQQHQQLQQQRRQA